MNIDNFVPKEVNEPLSEARAGETVTAEAYNNFLNILGEQGNNNNGGIGLCIKDIQNLQEQIAEVTRGGVADDTISAPKIKNDALIARHFSEGALLAVASQKQVACANANVAQLIYEAMEDRATDNTRRNMYLSKAVNTYLNTATTTATISSWVSNRGGQFSLTNQTYQNNVLQVQLSRPSTVYEPYTATATVHYRLTPPTARNRASKVEVMVDTTGTSTDAIPALSGRWRAYYNDDTSEILSDVITLPRGSVYTNTFTLNEDKRLNYVQFAGSSDVWNFERGVGATTTYACALTGKFTVNNEDDTYQTHSINFNSPLGGVEIAIESKKEFELHVGEVLVTPYKHTGDIRYYSLLFNTPQTSITMQFKKLTGREMLPIIIGYYVAG